MRIVVLSQVLKEHHRKKLSDTAAEIGTELCFAASADTSFREIAESNHCPA